MTESERFACPYCEKDYAGRGGLAYHVGTIHAGQGTPSATDEIDAQPNTEPTVVVPDDVEAPPAAPAEPSSDEIAPRKPRLVERLRSRRGRRGGPTQHPAPAERAPRKEKRKLGRRVALDADISDIWAFAGRRLEATPHYPTGRMLQYQAPAAGVILDRAIAGTLPDRVLLQPLARNRSKYEDVGFLLAGPVLTFSLTTTMGQMQKATEENDQEAYNAAAARFAMQRETFSWVLQMMLPRLAAGAKLAADKKAKRDAVIADAFPELGDEDPAEVLANMLFAPPTFRQEEPSDNSRGTYTDAPAGTATGAGTGGGTDG